MNPGDRFLDPGDKALERLGERFAPADQHVVMLGMEGGFASRSGCAKPALDAAAFRGVAGFFRDGKPEPRIRGNSLHRLQGERTPGRATSSRGPEELPPFGQSAHGGCNSCCGRHAASRLRPTAACGRVPGACSISCGRSWSPCESGIRGGAYAPVCPADMYASCVVTAPGAVPLFGRCARNHCEERTQVPIARSKVARLIEKSSWEVNARGARTSRPDAAPSRRLTCG